MGPTGLEGRPPSRGQGHPRGGTPPISTPIGGPINLGPGPIYPAGWRDPGATPLPLLDTLGVNVLGGAVQLLESHTKNLPHARSYCARTAARSSTPHTSSQGIWRGGCSAPPVPVGSEGSLSGWVGGFDGRGRARERAPPLHLRTGGPADRQLNPLVETSTGSAKATVKGKP